ncbi:MAG: hypothetical protein ACK56Q_10740, partial [Pirellulaceae bacterium]
TIGRSAFFLVYPTRLRVRRSIAPTATPGRHAGTPVHIGPAGAGRLVFLCQQTHSGGIAIFHNDWEMSAPCRPANSFLATLHEGMARSILNLPRRPASLLTSPVKLLPSHCDWQEASHAMAFHGRLLAAAVK